MLSCDVPGVSIARSIQRRDATGRSWICCVETDVDTSDRVVSTLRAITVAPGITPPLESLTVPAICAFWAWAPAANAAQKSNDRVPTARLSVVTVHLRNVCRARQGDVIAEAAKPVLPAARCTR